MPGRRGGQTAAWPLRRSEPLPRVVVGVSGHLCGQSHGTIPPHLGRALRSPTRCLLGSAFHALKRPVCGLCPWPGPPPEAGGSTAWQGVQRGTTARSRPGPGPRPREAGDPRSAGVPPPRLWL